MKADLQGLTAREVEERRARVEGGNTVRQITKSRGQIIRDVYPV